MATEKWNSQKIYFPRFTVKKWAIKIDAGTQAISKNSSERLLIDKEQSKRPNGHDNQKRKKLTGTQIVLILMRNDV